MTNKKGSSRYNYAGVVQERVGSWISTTGMLAERTGRMRDQSGYQTSNDLSSTVMVNSEPCCALSGLVYVESQRSLVHGITLGDKSARFGHQQQHWAVLNN